MSTDYLSLKKENQEEKNMKEEKQIIKIDNI